MLIKQIIITQIISQIQLSKIVPIIQMIQMIRLLLKNLMKLKITQRMKQRMKAMKNRHKLSQILIFQRFLYS